MATSDSPFFSLIIPTYKERENIGALLSRLRGLLDPALPGNYEIIVVDDDSPDETWRVAEEFCVSMPHLKVLRRQGERGLATAVVAGWKAARGQALGVIDADLQHPPEVLLRLVEAVRNGADLAVASRHVEGGSLSDWHLARRMLSRGAQLLANVLLPASRLVADPMSGYFAVQRAAIDLAEFQPLGYKILLEVLVRGQLHRIEEVGYTFQERQEGGSKVTWRQYLQYLVHLWRMRRVKRPQRRSERA